MSERLYANITRMDSFFKITRSLSASLKVLIPFQNIEVNIGKSFQTVY